MIKNKKPNMKLSKLFNRLKYGKIYPTTKITPSPSVVDFRGTNDTSYSDKYVSTHYEKIEKEVESVIEFIDIFLEKRETEIVSYGGEKFTIEYEQFEQKNRTKIYIELYKNKLVFNVINDEKEMWSEETIHLPNEDIFNKYKTKLEDMYVSNTKLALTTMLKDAYVISKLDRGNKIKKFFENDK